MGSIVTNVFRVLTNVHCLIVGALVSIAGAALLTTVGSIATSNPAAAQYYYYNGQYGYSRRQYRQRRAYVRKKRRRARSSRSSRKRRQSYAKTIREPISDVLVLISLKKQRVYVHDKKGLVAEAPISSGRRGMETPKGIFTILQKNKRHYSNLYAGAPMPNMQRITWSGVAMHGGALPGYPASHGCIRLPYSFAKKLFGITSMHGRVIVSDTAVKPRAIEHSNLFQPFPADQSLSSQAAAKDTQTTIDVAEAKPASRIDSDLGPVIGVDSDRKAKVARFTPDPARVKRANKYRQKRLARKATIERELAAAENQYDLLKVDVDRTADQLDAKRSVLKSGRANVAQKKTNVKKAEYVAQKAHKDLKDFDKKYRLAAQKLSGEKRDQLAKRENDLDTRALRLSDAASAAKKELVNAERRIAGLEANVALAANTHKTAVQKVAPVKKRIASAKADLAQFKEEEKQRAKPISVFISGKTGRLYARQGWQPILDIPIKIRKPEIALGTFLFTAIDKKSNGQHLEWSVVTVEDGSESISRRGRSKYRKYYGKKAGLRRMKSVPNPADLVLDRIEIPQDARDKIEDVMKPGSAIIISDYPKSIETGKHTDFIILTQ